MCSGFLQKVTAIRSAAQLQETDQSPQWTSEMGNSGQRLSSGSCRYSCAQDSSILSLKLASRLATDCVQSTQDRSRSARHTGSATPNNDYSSMIKMIFHDPPGVWVISLFQSLSLKLSKIITQGNYNLSYVLHPVEAISGQLKTQDWEHVNKRQSATGC